ncbi:MAG: dipeptidase, partial [Pseudomonadota bacterium]|nr:dipeptidase [Pseudomonadota bacterium]
FALLAIVGIGATIKLDAEALLDVNQVLPHEPFVISSGARELHSTLAIADWHTDSLMWLRDLLDYSDQGQVDFPRLRQGNVALQVFTSVTKVPDAGIQVTNNPGEGDKISLLAFADKWPRKARDSIYERALYHAEKMADIERRAPDQVVLIESAEELERLLKRRMSGEDVIGAVLGTEGLHPLEGSIENLNGLYEAGYRVMGLFHFFDNELGGSLHGMSGEGLNTFGTEVVKELNRRNIIIDVAHASPAAVEDVLALSDAPVVLSHTGMRGVCDQPRNISDELMLKIAEHGGLIGIGYFEIAICEMTPESVVEHIRYAIDLLGVDHVSLGSDYDGSVATPFDVSEISVLTHIMLERGFSEREIRAVMGGNTLRFLANNLPPM